MFSLKKNPHFYNPKLSFGINYYNTVGSSKNAAQERKEVIRLIKK